MEMIPVESSNLKAVGYNIGESKLEIEFKSGAAYEYYDVPQYVYDELMAADSLGKYADQNIYKVYKQNRTR